MKLRATTHIVIPDTQAKAGVPTDHLRWIGQYIVDEFRDKPVKIIHLGDHADMPSLSSYDKGKKSMEGRRVVADIKAANDAWAILNEAMVAFNKHRAKLKHKLWLPERHILMGNHEDRINRAVEGDPQLEGVFSVDNLDYQRSGWAVKPFREILMLDGVAYSHYFYNPMTGKPFGGNVEARLKTIGHTFTMGHQQTLMYGLRFVAGQSQHGLIAGACYLHDEDYKGPQGNAHWRGIVVKHEVRDGSYDPMFVSLDYLCRRYEETTLDRFISRKYPNLRRY
jgi:hypothetical protein